MEKGLIMKHFVLNPTKDDEHGRASRSAVLEYAKAIEYHNLELAMDLQNWISKLVIKIENKNWYADIIPNDRRGN